MNSKLTQDAPGILQMKTVQSSLSKINAAGYSVHMSFSEKKLKASARQITKFGRAIQFIKIKRMKFEHEYLK